MVAVDLSLYARVAGLLAGWLADWLCVERGGGRQQKHVQDPSALLMRPAPPLEERGVCIGAAPGTEVHAPKDDRPTHGISIRDLAQIEAQCPRLSENPASPAPAHVDLTQGP